MELWHLALLALVQGLTEFLPISSSAHLILITQWLGLKQNMVVDVATHVGSLLAVLWYFRRDLLAVMGANQLAGNAPRSAARQRSLALVVLVATAPAAVVGYFAADFIDAQLRSTLVIALTTIVFGLVLAAADWWSASRRDEYSLGWRGGLAIGTAQVLALIPGTSRSGITISAGQMLGLTRTAAARFSFLLSIPILALAGGYAGGQVAMGQSTIGWGVFSLAVGLSFIAALVTIAWFLRLVERIGLMPFAIYRVALGAVLLMFFV